VCIRNGHLGWNRYTPSSTPASKCKFMASSFCRWCKNFSQLISLFSTKNQICGRYRYFQITASRIIVSLLSLAARCLCIVPVEEVSCPLAAVCFCILSLGFLSVDSPNNEPVPPVLRRNCGASPNIWLRNLDCAGKGRNQQGRLVQASVPLFWKNTCVFLSFLHCFSVFISIPFGYSFCCRCFQVKTAKAKACVVDIRPWVDIGFSSCSRKQRAIPK